MLQIRSFGCTQYKAFRDPVVVELRPLTLFFGKNSSGKSALLRLVRLLLRAASGRSGRLRRGFPLEVDGLVYGTTFLDLVHGKLPNGCIDFHLALDQEIFPEPLELGVTVRHVQGALFDYPMVSHVRLNGEQWDWPLAQGIKRGVDHLEPEVPFSAGLWPDSRILHRELLARIEACRPIIADAEDCLTHLGPVRAPIKSVYKPEPPDSLAFNGDGFVNWLARDPELLRQVGAWFETHLDGWRLALDVAGSMVECVLRKGGLSINMADAGQGMQQVLPVVVLQLAHQVGSTEPFLDLVEEPESSLHAAAQAALGDLFLATAQLGRGQVLVETHSENLLLRIRRRIAEGRVAPDLVTLYWIEDFPEGFSGVRRIHLLPDGSVDWWPAGVFSEDYQEVRALRRANLERKQKEEVA
ncbi:MAG: AAA family ATPase [Magnetococcus sp. YQC-5]